MTVKLKVLRRHAPYGSLSGEETGELQPDVAGPCAIAILGQLAVLILANAQATNPIVVLHPLLEDRFHLRLHFGPRTARMKTFATRL